MTNTGKSSPWPPGRGRPETRIVNLVAIGNCRRSEHRLELGKRAHQGKAMPATMRRSVDSSAAFAKLIRIDRGADAGDRLLINACGVPARYGAHIALIAPNRPAIRAP
jgi:hypothetical protein